MYDGIMNASPKTRTPYLSSFFLVLTAFVALWQLWRTRCVIQETQPPQETGLPATPPRVTIIVPMRNEEANVDACLTSLVAQDYPNFEILVVDDGSNDGTSQLLRKWSERNALIRVKRVDRLPENWTGKAHALHTGVMNACSEWLLFTDADTRHAPQALRLMMSHALRYQVDLLSMRTNAMTLSGPIMPLLMPLSEILLASKVTPREVRDPKSARAFAFGQYILLKKEAYLSTGGYAEDGMHTISVEDVALAALFKRRGKRLDLVNGRGLITNRQWTTWKSALQGWGKSSMGEILRSHLAFAALPAGLALICYALIPLLKLFNAARPRRKPDVSLLLAGVTLLAQVEAKRSFDKEFGLPCYWSLTAPFGWMVCGVMTLDVGYHILIGRRYEWKGRHLPKQKAFRV
ncbi:MAG TPA: glycosyltransferase family 2 protein [Ktedonobacteraceae bacterium]|jgi:chlorobactene glucosyltransferase|nr:glycosyltransferase family 2 protein [Ktedonobacteraceae bacterium]